MSQQTVSALVSSPGIPTGGVITVAYPGGYSATDFASSGHVLTSRGLQAEFSSDDGEIVVAFGGSITVTYLGRTTIPAGTWASCDFALTELADSHYVAAVGDTPRSPAARASAQVIEAAEFGVTADADPVLTTQQMNNALNAIAELGGGRILQLPYGRINLTATDVAAGEGTSFLLGPTLSGLHVRGCGRSNTTLVAATNRIEMFAQVGAENVEFSNLTFESPSILQNEIKPAFLGTIGGGVAQWGNSANCAVRQYYGGGTTMRRIGFHHWCLCLNYFGDYRDRALLSGTAHMEDIVADDYVQCLLCNEPRIINFINIELSNGKDSINGGGGIIDPGHGIYITDRGGGYPESVMISNIRAVDNYSSAVKIRKAQTAVVQGVTVYNCGRGVEINNCMRATVSDLSISLSNIVLDSGRTALNFDNCGPHEVSNVFIDIRGLVAYGVRIRPDPTGIAMPEYPMQYGRVSNITIMEDFAAGSGLSPFTVTNAVDCTYENIRVINVGAVGNSKWPIYLFGCTRCRVLWPQHSSLNLTGDAYALVQIDAVSVDCSVIYQESAIDVAPTVNTVADAGTGSKVTRITSGTPGTPTFPNGTVTAPGIAFTNDLDSGFFVNGANNWSLTAGGVEQMRWLADRTVICTNIRPLADGTQTIGSAGLGWKSMIMTPLAVQPSPHVGEMALSDGAVGSAGWGSGGAGLYRWNGAAWVFVG